jgi:hypothetical protein
MMAHKWEVYVHESPFVHGKTADDACSQYHYLVVESRGSVRFPDGVGLDITRLRSVRTSLPKPVLPETQG